MQMLGKAVNGIYRQMKKTNITLMIIIIAISLTITALLYENIIRIFRPHIPITIIATGEYSNNNPNKQTEVWILDIVVNGREVNLSKISLPEGWELSAYGTIVSNINQPASLELLLPQGYIEIVFLEHPWSGIVAVEVLGESQRFDLFINESSRQLRYEVDTFIQPSIRGVAARVVLGFVIIFLFVSALVLALNYINAKDSIGKIKITIGEKWVILILSGLTFIICAWSIPGRSFPYVYGDEFLLFSIAAHFAGLDWSHVTASSPYTSYGYSLLLTPFFYLFDSFRPIYTSALVINAILASLIVPLSYALYKRWGGLNFKDNWLITIIILFCSLSGAVIAYTALGLGEVALVTTAFACTLCIQKLCDKNCHVVWYITTAVLLIYGYILHQRFFGAFIAGIITVAIMVLLKKIKWYKFFVFSCTIIIIFIIHSLVKQSIQENLWLIVETGEPLRNDWDAVIHLPAARLSSWSNIYALISMSAGHLYYLIISSFSLILFALHKLVCVNTNLIRHSREIRNSNDTYDFSTIFIFIAFIFTFVISAISLGIGRGDQFFAGRYNIIMSSVLCIYIFSLIIKGDYKITRITPILISVFVVLTHWVSSVFFTYHSQRLYFRAFTIDLILPMELFGEFVIYISALICIFVGILLLWSTSGGKRVLVAAILIICILVSNINARIFINEANNGWVPDSSARAEDLVLNMPDTTNPVYLFPTSDGRFYKDLFQMLLLDTVLLTTADINALENEVFYLIIATYWNDGELSEIIDMEIDDAIDIELVYTNGHFSLYLCTGAEDACVQSVSDIIHDF